MMKYFKSYSLSLIVSLVLGECCMARDFTPYSVRCRDICIDYTLPSGVQFLWKAERGRYCIAKLPQETEVPCLVFGTSVGWAWKRNIPNVAIDVFIYMIPNSRFVRGVPSSDWLRVLSEERFGGVSSLPAERKIVTDASGREWIYVYCEGGLPEITRTYIRPIAPDLVLVLRANLESGYTGTQSTDSTEVLTRIRDGIKIVETANSGGDKSQ